MAAFIASFIFVVLAEMGDKTQLLAMGFATRYSAHKVLIAVALATLVNHSLAVACGHFLSIVIPLEAISFAAALSFIIFGLWTIRGDRLKGEDKRASRFGPVLTVGIAFFLVEMGDKTQLATVSLAVKYQNMVSVLLGTTLGMVVADAVGIVAGIILRKHIPQKAIKWFSAVIFILFGLIGLYKILILRLSGMYAWTILLSITAGTVYAASFIVSGLRQETLLKT